MNSRNGENQLSILRFLSTDLHAEKNLLAVVSKWLLFHSVAERTCLLYRLRVNDAPHIQRTCSMESDRLAMDNLAPLAALSLFIEVM